QNDLPSSFWERIYTRAREEFGTTDIPVDTFNKVWITADKAKVFEHKDTAYVVDAHLKVMLESDYLAENKTSAVSSQRSAENAGASDNKDARELSKQLLREVVLPEIEKEVNEGANFAPVRQMFYSMIMASWYKLALKDALLNQVYSNKSKTGGVLTDDPAVKEKIYEQYLAAYKKGVFNYIKEEPDAVSQQAVPHKYFSGGLKVFTGDPAQIIERLKELPERYRFELVRQLNKTLMASVQVAGTVAGSSEEVQEALGIGAEYRKNGNIPKAIVSFRRAIELAPNNAFAHASLGMAYKDEGNLNLGADQLSIAARLDPVYKIQYQTLYAAQLIVAGEFGRAVDNLQEAIKSHEKEFPSNVYAMAHAYLAIGLYAAGDRKAALEEYKVALEQAPFNEELSGLVSRSGRPSLSARFTAFLRALKHKPAIKSLPSVEQQAAAVEQNIRGLVDQLQTGYSLKVMPTSTGALLVEMTQSYLPGSKSVLKTVRDNYRDIATQVSPSARVKVISADAYSLKFEISDAAMLEYRYQGGLDYTIQAVLSTVRDVFQQSSQNAHVSIMWNQTVYVGYEIAVVENVSQLEGLPQLLKAELSKVPSDEFPANTPLSVLLARDPATGMVTNIEIAPFNYHNIIGTLNFHGGLLVQTQEAGQALYYSFGVMAADDQHEAYTIDWDSKTNQNRLVIDTSVPLDEARRQQLFDEITGFIPALLSHKKIVNMADVKAKLADLLGVQDAAMLADKFIVSPRSAVQSIVSTLNGASLNWFDDRKLPVYLYGWAGQDIGREIAQATTADWRNGFVDLSAKLQESLVNAHGDVPLFMVELETGDRVPLIHSVKIRVLQYSDMLSALNDQNSLYVSVSAEQGKMPSKYQFRVAAANEQHPDGTTDWDSRELTGTVYIDTNVPVGQLDRQGLFDKIMALVRVKVDTKAYENIARMETRLAGFLGVPVLREAIRVAEGKVKYLHIKALARQGEDKPVELEEARQELARGRFQYGGDVVYVGEMSPAARQDSVISAVQAGLIPALGLEYQTREARGITNTTATLAQIVRRGGGDAVAAVKAGADVLLASGMLTRQDVADARAAAEAMGKKVVIIVGADAKRRDVMAAIQMAAVVKADGIRLMSAAATPEQAGKTRDIVKWAKQNHPDLLLMVEDGVT
ncbi:MAG: tetratricopeptide repeat protein, partial [Candidatus Omnitrophica bacterium]|nr:tetratricopeptide repeat protein [Candidatus Omnitrophota bacterium]